MYQTNAAGLVNLDDAISAIDAVQQPIQNNTSVVQQSSVAVGNTNTESDNGDDYEEVEDPLVAHLALTEPLKPPPHPLSILSISKSSKTNPPIDEVLIDDTIAFLHWHALHTRNCPALSQIKGKTNNCRCMLHFQENVHEEDDSTTPLTLATA
jgi:hypothetical protein